MARPTLVAVATLLLSVSVAVFAEDPYIFMDWNVSYGTISPLGVPVQGILINGLFPGPTINSTSNNNIVVNVYNNLDEPLLFTWSGIQQRKNSWQDGTPGTMCPIQPGMNFTYHFQVKDQIGSYVYFPTTGMLKAAGGIGPLNVHSRALIPVPFDINPADEFNVLAGDWFNKGHKSLKRLLDNSHTIGRPDGIHINGKSGKVGEAVSEPMFTMEPGKTYRYRLCNVGLRTSLNFRFQGHPMKLVELEGSHTVQELYKSLDVHVGQCMSVLVTADKEPKDYYLVASARFSKQPLSTVAVIRYANSNGAPSTELPPPPPENTAGIVWSLNQFRSFRWNLTASAARPNPQGSYHYGNINITRTIKIANTRTIVDGKLRFGINGVSHVDPTTPLKLAEYFGKAQDVFKYDIIGDEPPAQQNKVILAPNVVNATFRNFVEIIFENSEHTIQTWHLDGYSFFAVGMESGKWSPEKRKNYNLVDGVSRHTIHVYPNSWAAVMTTLDNAGMWSLRSDMWERFYLGQQMYVSVLSPERSLRDEYDMPANFMVCGIVKGLPLPAPYTS
ncbi:L-ascorbate oxidase-like [Heracleum sosnowskyi]|uniref:L-ascorbate oxidase-like n=1 Tax=Heracleum sosnowskyi TaxID=360622 RepID=A0AAD8ISC9_9APIA|nr:L-ascorbate oxidase-like [Heracleum sosnowskyi]